MSCRHGVAPNGESCRDCDEQQQEGSDEVGNPINPETCATWREAFEKFSVVHPFTGSLERYIVSGIPTGGFLRAILENDLLAAVTAAANDEARAQLPCVVFFLFNEAPGQCWGSKEKVTAWLAERRQ